MDWKKYLATFAGTFFVVFVASYVIVTVFPVFAFCVLVINQACQTGNLLSLLLSLVPYTLFWAVVLSPGIVNYFKMKKELEELRAKIDEDLDADL